MGVHVEPIYEIMGEGASIVKLTAMRVSAIRRERGTRQRVNDWLPAVVADRV